MTFLSSLLTMALPFSLLALQYQPLSTIPSHPLLKPFSPNISPTSLPTIPFRSLIQNPLQYSLLTTVFPAISFFLIPFSFLTIPSTASSHQNFYLIDSSSPIPCILSFNLALANLTSNCSVGAQDLYEIWLYDIMTIGLIYPLSEHLDIFPMRLVPTFH